MKCRICNEELVFFETVSGCRAEAVGTMLRSVPYTIAVGDLTLYECPQCGHIQAEYLLPEGFYDQYLPGSGLEQYTGSHIVLDQQFSKLSRLLGKEDGTLLEIGCGSGEALHYAGKYFSKCIGYDTSATECEIARNRFGDYGKYEIYNQPFDEHSGLTDEIDAVCSFQVFEHLENIITPLKEAYRTLKYGGVGLINVPNGQQIVSEGLYHQINYEHINYFSPYSLALLCMKCGFQIIDIETDHSAIEINAYVFKGEKKSLNESRENHKHRLMQELGGIDKYAIYGAGAKAMYYSSLMDFSKAAYLFDSDYRKIDKYISGLPIPVSKYDREKACFCDAIVIFATSYSEEISNMLRRDGFSGKIIIP